MAITRLGAYGASRALYGSFAGKGEAIVPPAPTSTIIEGGGSGKYPNEDDLVRWLQGIFPKPIAKSARAAKQSEKRAKKPAERIIADAREWVVESTPEELSSLIRESKDLKALVKARQDYKVALAEFRKQEQDDAQEQARQIIAAYVKRMRDDDEAMKLILELI